MSGWGFYAMGTPAPQGSKRIVTMGARAGLREMSPRLAPWREAVKAMAPTAPTLDGPIAVRMVFTVPRPKAVRPKHRTRPQAVPDLSKLARSTEDAITDVGGWSDDARVAEYTRLAKVWAGYDEEALPVPGVVVAACEVDRDDYRERLIAVMADVLAMVEARAAR